MTDDGSGKGWLDGMSALGSSGWTGGEDWSRAGWRAHLPAATDVPAYAESLGEATIPALAAASAAAVPGRVAVSIDGQPITHAELDAGAAGVAGWLAARLNPGSRVLIAAGSSHGFLRCYLGALRAGAVVVLANPGYTAAELAHLAADSGAAAAFAAPGPARALAGLASPPLTVDIRQPPEGPGLAAGEIGARPDDVALLAYTSGTTGRPKGVPLTHRQLLISVRSAMAAWRWSADDVMVHALPLFHQHGLGGVHATLIAGGTAHLRSKFVPAELIGTILATRASMLLGVPAVYQGLLNVLAPGGPPPPEQGPGPELPGSGPAGHGSPLVPGLAGVPPEPGAGGGLPGTGAGRDTALAGLRLAVCGSAPLSPALAQRLAAVLGRPPLIRYGTTETGLSVSNTCGDPRGDTVGLPLPGVLARIWSSGAEAAPGADGEIQLRGPQVFSGYWNDPVATAAAFTEDGWFRTGDIGRVDPGSGHLVICGRIKEMIITGGLNVYPREVENVLEQHPWVAEAVVAGMPHDRWGEQVTAWVVLRPGGRFDERQLIAHARTALAAYKCPKRVYEVPSVPRNHVGKVLRSALTPGQRPAHPDL